MIWLFRKRWMLVVTLVFKVSYFFHLLWQLWPQILHSLFSKLHHWQFSCRYFLLHNTIFIFDNVVYLICLKVILTLRSRCDHFVWRKWLVYITLYQLFLQRRLILTNRILYIKRNVVQDACWWLEIDWGWVVEYGYWNWILSFHRNTVVPYWKWQLWELNFWDLVISVHDLMRLQYSSWHLTKLICVDMMPVAHMRVLLRPLFESTIAAKHWTTKRRFSCVYSDMVLKGRAALSFATTPLTYVIYVKYWHRLHRR